MNNEKWFKTAVIYQIYPRSFFDSNNDGVGDLNGITSNLSYLKGRPDSLGVDAIWISPIYTSPMADFGYDIKDHRNIDSIFGNLEDFQTLLKAAKEHDLKVIMDFVPNHTSEQHPWFVKSRSSLDNPKRDWYVWRSGMGDQPPNNWIGVFGGSSWNLDDTTGQYYLHSFIKEQPDLNWDNPEVREAMKDTMRFWLDMGVDGFRMDAVPWLSKSPEYLDDPLSQNLSTNGDPYLVLDHLNSRDGPNLTKYLNELAMVVKRYKNKFMVIEAYPDHRLDIDAYIKLYNEIDSSVCSPFNFESIFLPWQAQAYKTFIDSFQASLKPGYTPMFNFGNHDVSRLVNRIGKEQARVAAMLLLSLPGAPTIYNGDELGMADVEVPKDKIQDPREFLVPGKGLGRDPERVPLPWNSDKYAGFSKAEPWLPLPPDYEDNNITSQQLQADSFLNLYKQLLRLRSKFSALKYGSYGKTELDPRLYGFIREHNGQKLIVVLNFSDSLVELPFANQEVIISTYLDSSAKSSVLRANEGMILKA